jgi:hypothetical protein
LTEAGADLTGFLEAAGRSLADAQQDLAGEVAQVPTVVAIAEAELEVKATLERVGAGGVALQPVSSGDARQADISPGLLSTVTVRYVMAAEDTLVSPAERPTKTPDKVIAEVKRREELKVLGKILGGLTFDATFGAFTKRWLVTAKDPEDRLVREVVVPDEGG